MPRVQVGKKVPDFTLPTTHGDFRLKDRRGRRLVLYFYPRDNTPGCTREGRDFSELHPRLKRAKTDVLGISTDTLASHERFRLKMGFPFELGSDERHRVAGLFGVWKEKTLYGRRHRGIERSTFLIDEHGVLRREWRKVRVDGHADDVLAAARAL